MTAATYPSVVQIAERHDALLSRLRRVAERHGHDPDGLRIVAVTKTWPVEVARAALDAGIERLGENRVQEAESKVAALPGAEWHLVGRLQSNKVRRAVCAFAAIHSVDSFELLERVARAGTEEGRAPRILLQVNVSGEPSKAGMAPDDLLAAAPGARLADLGVVGLMTIAPMGIDHDGARAIFAQLRRLRDGLQELTGRALPELSMGMSSDAEAAAAEGATLVRIGTALFGPRG